MDDSEEDEIGCRSLRAEDVMIRGWAAVEDWLSERGGRAKEETGAGEDG
jgi:hypothetical protein